MIKLRLWGVGIFSFAVLAIFRLVFGFCHEKLHFSCLEICLFIVFSFQIQLKRFFYLVSDVVLFFFSFLVSDCFFFDCV